jgi:hypothetical protein
MMIDHFLKKIARYRSKVAIAPLIEEDVVRIEERLGRQLPEYYREFLLKIGLKQDLVPGLFNKVDDFKPLTDFLPPGQSERFFQFGDNGGEDYWLLRSDDHSDLTIYEYEYYGSGQINSLGRTFEDLLNEAVQHLEENASFLVDNSKKLWAVQFAIDTPGELEIVAALEDFGCTLLNPVKRTEVSPAGVICSEGMIRLLNKDIPLKKQEYSAWATPCFYFDWEEPLEEMNNNSAIKRFEDQLKAKGLNVTLVDYGIQTKSDV